MGGLVRGQGVHSGCAMAARFSKKSWAVSFYCSSWWFPAFSSDADFHARERYAALGKTSEPLMPNEVTAMYGFNLAPPEGALILRRLMGSIRPRFAASG